jgi:hypothetical protein
VRPDAAIALIGIVACGCASLAPAPPQPAATSRVEAQRGAGQRGAGQPAATNRGTAADPAVAQAQATHEYPGPAPPRESAQGSASAVGAVAAFANAYINWNAHTVAPDMAALAQRSVGQARSEMELAAAQTGSDYELRRGGIANSGTVEAVARLSGPGGRYVVVTRERTTATATNTYQGLQPAWHVAVATVARVGAGRWAVSGWQPES